LRIELISSDLEDLTSRLDLVSSDEAEFDDLEDSSPNSNSEVNLISTCSAPVARTVLWEILRALADSEVRHLKLMRI